MAASRANQFFLISFAALTFVFIVLLITTDAETDDEFQDRAYGKARKDIKDAIDRIGRALVDDDDDEEDEETDDDIDDDDDNDNDDKQRNDRDGQQRRRTRNASQNGARPYELSSDNRDSSGFWDVLRRNRGWGDQINRLYRNILHR